MGSLVLLLASSPGLQAQDSTFFAELHNMMPQESFDTWCVAAGDLDGDGDIDLVYGEDPHGIHLALNDGSGLTTDAAANLPQFDWSTRAVALGDVDGDSDLDIVLGNRSNPVGLFLNNGSAVFSDATSQMPSKNNDLNDIALIDVDGDSDLDVVIGNRGQNQLYLNDGSGFFKVANQLPNNSNQTSSLFPGDVDSDGDIDLAEGNEGQNSLYLNDGSGFFTDATSQLPAALDETDDLSMGDIDGDGDLDLVVANSYHHSYSIQNRLYLNDGTGRFIDAAAQLPFDDDCTAAILFQDTDSDGDLDLYLGNEYSYDNFTSRDRLYLNDGAGLFSAAPDRIPEDEDRTRDVLFADMDGDGDSDMVVGNNGQNRLYLNDGAGFFSDVSAPLATGGHECLAVAAGDVDNDGDPDVLVGCGDWYGCRNRLYINDGSGNFIDRTDRLPMNHEATRDAVFGDLDCDGDLDVYIANNGRDALYLNDGTGTFVDASFQIPGFIGESSSAVFGDVDRDGDLDIMVSGHLSSGDRLFLNDGHAVFSDASIRFVPPSEQTRSLALGDVDGDGDLDAVMAKWWQNGLYLNNGSGVFLEASGQLPADTDDTNSVALGDVDGDGDLDLYFGNEGVRDRLYLNDGTGSFTDGTTQLPDHVDNTEAVALADLDGDGDPDALVGNSRSWHDDEDRLYTNDGNGVFSDASSLLPQLSIDSYALAVHDLDMDGDSDILLGSLDHTRIYSNLGRQIAWRALPRTDRELTMDIHGPAGGWFRLAVSTRRCHVPHPPFGILRIDPSYVLSEQRGWLNGSGFAERAVKVPASSILLGRSLYWQALLGPELSLSNLETTTFSNL